MKLSKRYYPLKMKDGWHVWCEEIYTPPKRYNDVLGRPMPEKEAKRLVEDLEKTYARK